MSVRSLVISRYIAHVISRERQENLRRSAESARQRRGLAHVVDYFHQVDDPYCHLTAQVLTKLLDRYHITLRPHLVSQPPDWAATARTALVEYSRLDAARLAKKAGLRFLDPGRQPDEDEIASAERQLAAISPAEFPDAAVRFGTALWDLKPVLECGEEIDAAATKLAGNRLRDKLGHYLGATFHYGGEWYWGIDRLHYLESRLSELGLKRPNHTDLPIFAPPELDLQGPHIASAKSGTQTLEMFISFRSPYSYLAINRVKEFADARGLELIMRFVLPMITRGFPMPKSKRKYMIHDAAREARHLNIPFGRICDPLGKPVARGYALLPFARDQGRLYEYCNSFLRSVWSQGIDAGTNRGLALIIENAGLNWTDARQHLADDAWRAEAEINYQALSAMNLWGVPSFRLGDLTAWGQDRLWIMEDALNKMG